MKSGYEYCKYVYWPEESSFDELKAKIEAGEGVVKECKAAVCGPLSKHVRMGYVRPESWGRFDLCKSQVSWYGSSRHYGRILLVSSSDLKEFGVSCEVVIRQSSFKPQRFPSDEEKARLIERAGYKNARPEEWKNIVLQDAAEKERRLRVMGLRGVKFDELFLSHCANHANFIDPAFFIVEEGERIPYSICKTSHVCSACMEWYNIIGDSFRKKLVVPCPGAALFGGLITNRYYEVTKCASD